jgi:hypothetical protein
MGLAGPDLRESGFSIEIEEPQQSTEDEGAEDDLDP